MTPRKKSVVVALGREGYSCREISSRVWFHYSTVNQFLRKYAETRKLEQFKGRGRKAATTPQQDRYLTRLSLRNRFATSNELRRDMEGHSGVQVSARTIRRRLLNAGLAARHPQKKPLLTKDMMWASWNGQRIIKTGLWSTGDRLSFPMNQNSTCITQMGRPTLDIDLENLSLQNV